MSIKTEKLSIFINKDQIAVHVWERLVRNEYWNLGFDYADQDIFLTYSPHSATSPKEVKVAMLKPFVDIDNRYCDCEVTVVEDGLLLLIKDNRPNSN